MNKCIFMGRLTKDPEISYTRGENSMMVAKYSLAVDRRKGDKADFPPIVSFSSAAEFAQKYFKKGMRVLLTTRYTQDSYDGQDGRKVYTHSFVVEDQEFCESKGRSSSAAGDGFMNIPEGMDEEMPFA